MRETIPSIGVRPDFIGINCAIARSNPEHRDPRIGGNCVFRPSTSSLRNISNGVDVNKSFVNGRQSFDLVTDCNLNPNIYSPEIIELRLVTNAQARR